MTKDTDLLTEYVRQGLSRQITNQFVKGGTVLKVLTLGGGFEKRIADAIQKTEVGNYLALEANETQSFLEQVSQQLELWTAKENDPIILCSPAIRMYVRQLLERYFPQVAVISYNELEPQVEIQSIGVVNAA